MTQTAQSAGPIDELFVRLRSGEEKAAQALWNEYSVTLVNLAKQRLGNISLGMTDEEDVALSVFGSICRGAAEGRFTDVTTRDELWWLLLRITRQKAASHIRREMAVKRRINRQPEGKDTVDDVPVGIEDLISREPSPDFLITLEEESSRLMQSLRDDCLRTIVVLRIEGYLVSEIAERLSVSGRTVERKLQLIRDKWARELTDSSRR
jgi:DNA-directed RNA polymerase specialized sigma24 family protein